MLSQISGALAERGTCATTWLSWIARNMSMDWQNLAMGRLGQWAAAHSSHCLYPSLSLGHLPHQCQGLWQAWQSTGKGHGAGVSGHCLPFAAEPHSAWPALNHRGLLAGITRPSSLSPSKLPLALLSLCRCIKTLRSAWEKLLLLHYPAVSIHRTCKNQVPHQKIIKAIL